MISDPTYILHTGNEAKTCLHCMRTYYGVWDNEEYHEAHACSNHVVGVVPVDGDEDELPEQPLISVPRHIIQEAEDTLVDIKHWYKQDNLPTTSAKGLIENSLISAGIHTE